MSVSNKEISSFTGIDGDDDDDEDEDDDDGGTHKKKPTATTRRYGFCGGGFSFSRGLGKKAKSFLLSPLKKKRTHAKAKASSSSSSSGNNTVNEKGCCFCLTQSSSSAEVSRSPSGSHTSDPNDPNFTYDMLRVLIERNDFFCKESNPHSDYEDS